MNVQQAVTISVKARNSQRAYGRRSFYRQPPLYLILCDLSSFRLSYAFCHSVQLYVGTGEGRNCVYLVSHATLTLEPIILPRSRCPAGGMNQL